MKRNYRLSLKPCDKLEADLIWIHDQDSIHQIEKVLRIKLGHKEKIQFINGSGWIWDSQLEELGSKYLKFRIYNTHESNKELDISIKFFVPLIKKENFHWMIQKLTEIGVQEFVPVCFSRSQDANIKSFNREKIIRIIQEATEQCEGARYSKISDPIAFEDISQYLNPGALVFANETLAGTRVNPIQTKTKSWNLLVGPEGGLTDEEIESLSLIGFEGVSLGARLLRAGLRQLAWLIRR